MLEWLRRSCRCRILRQCAEDPAVPIRFDPDLNEFSLDYDCNEDRASRMMRYCFWCGGRLPKSRRGELFTKPSGTEINDVCRVLSKATTFAELITSLGPPDREFQSNDRQIVKQVDYARRWTTLDLTVFVHSDGSFEAVWSGKYKGQTESQPTV